MENKIFAIKRLVDFRKKEYKWWSVIDCGETKVGGMTVGNFWHNHFKKDGRTYRYYAELFMPPVDLVEWKEIKIIDKLVTVIDNDNIGGNIFEGWEDKEDEGLRILQNFAKLLDKNLSIDEIKDLLETSNNNNN